MIEISSLYLQLSITAILIHNATLPFSEDRDCKPFSACFILNSSLRDFVYNQCSERCKKYKILPTDNMTDWGVSSSPTKSGQAEGNWRLLSVSN